MYVRLLQTNVLTLPSIFHAAKTDVIAEKS